MSRDDFMVKKEEDGIYVTIMNPAFDIGEVIDYLKERKIMIDLGRVTSDLVYRQSDVVKISDRLNMQSEEDQICRISLKVSPNKMLAFLTIEPIFPDEFDEQTLIDFLNYHRITYGISKEFISELVKSAQPVYMVPIAKGTPPGKGQEGHIVYFHRIPEKVPKMDNRGRVNYHEVHHSIHVRMGEIIAARVPAGCGKSGCNVYGEEIPGLPGDEAQFQVGRGIIIKYDKAIAALDGTLDWDENGRVSVSRLFRVNSDVNFVTGNISFDGDVCIEGDVKPGFKVSAEGDIHIYGLVDNAEIISAAGSIIVDGPILGRGHILIKAFRDIKARYIQNAVLEAGNNIYIEDYVTRCSLKAGNKIDLSSGKGLILGYNIINARNALIVKNITNPDDVELNIEGFNPDDYRNRIIELDKEIDHGTRILNELARERTLNLNQLKSGSGNLKYEQMLGKAFSIERNLESLYREKLALEEVLKTVAGRGMVHILCGPVNTLKLSINGTVTIINNSYGKAIIYYDPENRMIKME